MAIHLQSMALDGFRNACYPDLLNGCSVPRRQRENPDSSDTNDLDYNYSPDEGTISDVKNLYQSKPDGIGQSTWVDKIPDDLEEIAETAETARYALLVRNKKCYSGRKKFEVDSIVVQSGVLKKSLAKILEEYPGITTNIKRLTFTPPFTPFVHRWKQLETALEGVPEKTSKETEGDDDYQKMKEHLKLLFDILKEELSDTIRGKHDLVANHVMTFDLIWTIFEPGVIVFAQGDAFKLLSAGYDAKHASYHLQCQYIDWDGENFGTRTRRLDVPTFNGTMSIQELPVYPLKHHPDKCIEEKLVARGVRFRNLCDVHYKAYTGIATGMGPCGPVKYSVNSRIVIDASSWSQFNPNQVRSIAMLSQGPTVIASPRYRETDFWTHGEANPAKHIDGRKIGTMIGPTLITKDALLSNDQLLITASTVKGYSLSDKEWLSFSVDLVQEIVWDEHAFDKLVISQDCKDLILAVAESQIQHKENFDDVIQGKGKGMIMLLSGPPGVGKTLTAESVAERMRVPLYMMSAVDLGVHSAGIESALSRVLKMVTNWNAVLLLDEADVFLEQRTSHDLERNKLVSIFLRTLEYYSGILFLTTNRLSSIDEAFHSRIHIRLSYQPLSVSSRRSVWVNFLKSSGCETGFSVEDIDELAEKELNGRQIKNLVKTAVLVAMRKGEDLKKHHVETVLAIDPQ